MTTQTSASAGATLTCSIPEAAHRLGIGLSNTKMLIARGDVQTVRIGRRRLVVSESLRDFIAKLAQQ
jgi:excisionase family DNA binding protein